MSEKKQEQKATAQTDVYTIAELCRAEKRLGASYDVIRAALIEKKVQLASIEEAKKIVSAFKERKVK